MGSYLVSGVKVSQDGSGRVTQASAASLSIFFQGVNSGFTFDYDAPLSDTAPTPVTLTTIKSNILLHGKSITSGFDIALGATERAGNKVQLLEIYDRDTGDLYFFQLQGGATSKPLTTPGAWTSFLNTSGAFQASTYHAGSVILPGQFQNDSFTDNDKLSLTADNDTVNTGGGKDSVYAGEGDDLIETATGHDTLYGGNGNDTFLLGNSVKLAADKFLEGNEIYGGGGTDTLAFDLSKLAIKSSFTIDLSLGTALIDGPGHTVTKLQSIENLAITGASAKLHSVTITGGDGANAFDLGGGTFTSIKIFGGSGADMATGMSGNCTIDSGSGNDTIQMESGSLHALGGTGDDVIISNGTGIAFEKGDMGNDFLQGGSAADKLIGDNGDDTLWGMDGKDSLYGGIGDDSIDGGGGQDLVYGGFGNDYIAGGDGNDELYGSDGNDTIYGVSGQDTLTGGAGDDFIYGGTGNRVAVHGGDGEDNLTAGGQTSRPADGTDHAAGQAIFGDRGNDTLTGNWGEDTLDGGDGYDWMQGFVSEDGHKMGDGMRDVFVLSGPAKTGPIGISDMVTYFEVGVDKLDLSELGVAMRLVSGDFNRDKVAKMHYDASTGILEADLEGKGKIAWLAEIHTIGHAQLTNADFIF